MTKTHTESMFNLIAANSPKSVISYFVVSSHIQVDQTGGNKSI